MLVLYKELTTYETLRTYLKSTDLPTICANIAISCAVHDQQLDESMNISGKTTTNISPQDFCEDQILGDCFQGNLDNFHQLETLSFLKDNLQKFTKIYNLLENESSKSHFLSLLLFFLCPFTDRFFSLAPTPKTLHFPSNTLNILKEEQSSLQTQETSLTLPLGQSLSDFLEIPTFLLSFQNLKSLSFQISKGDFFPYLCTLTVNLKKNTLSDETYQTPPSESPISDETHQNPPSESPISDETHQNPPSQSPISDETTPNPEPPPLLITEPLSSFLENDSTEKSPPQEETIPTKQKIPLPETSYEETKTLESLINQVDIPPPDQPSTPSTDLFPESPPPDPPQPEENTEETPDPPQPDETPEPPPLQTEIDGTLLTSDQLFRSHELLSTMEELVLYLHKQYPTDDPICAELLNSMLQGIGALRNTLK